MNFREKAKLFPTIGQKLSTYSSRDLDRLNEQLRCLRIVNLTRDYVPPGESVFHCFGFDTPVVVRRIK